MTKQLKKGLIAVLMVVFAVMSCFAVLGTSTAKADVEYTAEEQAFITALDAFDGKAIDETLLARENWDALNALVDAAKVIDIDTNEKFDAERTEYYAIANGVYKDALDAYSKIRNLGTLANPLPGTIILYSQYDEKVTAAEEAYALLDNADEIAYVDFMTDDCYNLNKVNADKVALEAKIADAIAAIAAIDYYNDAWFDAANDYVADDAQLIVLDSESSIDDAEEAIFAIYNMELPESEKVYVTNLAAYETAVEVLAAQYAKADAVVEAIDTLYAEVDFNDKLYTLEYYPEPGKITVAEEAYADIADATGHNDLQGLVENYDKLVEIRDAHDAIDAQIDAVEVLIRDTVPSVENVRLIKAHLDAIVAAEAAVDALPADVKNDVNIVWGLRQLLDVRAKYDEMAIRVNNLVEWMETFLEIYGTEETVVIDEETYDAIKLFRKLIVATYKSTSITQDEKDMLNPTVIATDNGDSTWYELFQAYNTIVEADYDLARAVITKIANIGEVELTVECGARIDAARKAYDAIIDNEAVKAHVDNDNYSVLVAAEARYAELRAELDAWETAVEAIGEVTVYNLNAVIAVENTWNFDLTAQLKSVANAEVVATFEAAVEAKDAICKKIELVVKSFSEIPEGYPAEEDVVEYNNLVEAATTTKNALLTVEDAFEIYFEGAEVADGVLVEDITNIGLDLQALNAKYEDALIICEAVAFEARIALLPAADVIDVDSYDVVYELVADIVDSEIDTTRIRNYDKLEAAVATLEAIVAKLQAWADKVADIKATYVALDKDELYPIYLVIGKGLTLEDAEFEDIDFTDDIVTIIELIAEYDGAYDYDENLGEIVLMEGFTDAQKAFIPTINLFGVNGLNMPASAEALENALFDALIAAEDLALAMIEVVDRDATLDEKEADLRLLHAVYTAFDDVQRMFADEEEYDVDVTIIAAFMNLYNKLLFSENFKAAVDALKDGAMTKENAIAIDVLYSIYYSAAEELQKLDLVEEAKADLDVLKAELEANGVEYSWKAEVEQIKADIDAINSALDLLTNADDFSQFVADTNAKFNSIEADINALKEFNGPYTSLNEALKSVVVALNEHIDNVKAELEGKIADALVEAKDYADGLIEDLKAIEIAELSAKIDELNKFNAGYESLNKALKDVRVALDEHIDNKVAELEAKIAEAAAQALASAKAYTDEKVAAINDELFLIKGSIKDIVNGMDFTNAIITGAIEELSLALETAKAAFADADAALKAAYEAKDAELVAAIAAAKAALENAIDDAESALNSAIAAEKAAREAEDAKIRAELEDAVAKLNKTITIITVILSVVSVACAGALVYIFLKKRA